MATPLSPRRRPSLPRLLELGLALLFVGAGSIKLIGLPVMVRLFEAMGVGQWLRYAVGAGELTGGLLLLAPATALAGALVLVGMMAGAIASDVLVLHTLPLAPIGVLCLLGLVVHLRRAELMPLARSMLPLLRRGGPA